MSAGWCIALVPFLLFVITDFIVWLLRRRSPTQVPYKCGRASLMFALMITIVLAVKMALDSVDGK